MTARTIRARSGFAAQPPAASGRLMPSAAGGAEPARAARGLCEIADLLDLRRRVRHQHELRDPVAVRPVALEAREPRRDADRNARAHAHALGGVLALHLAGELVQLRQAAALAVGHEQLHRAERAEELRLDRLV